MSLTPGRQDGTKPAHPPAVALKGGAKPRPPSSGVNKQTQHPLQGQSQSQGHIQAQGETQSHAQSQFQNQPRRSHEHPLGLELGEIADLRRSSSVNRPSSSNDGNGRSGDVQNCAPTANRRSSGSQSAIQITYSTGSPQIASSPGAAQVRHKSPIVVGHSAPPTPTMSPPLGRVGKDPRSPGAASLTEGLGAGWKPIESNSSNNHGANVGMPTHALPVGSPIAPQQSFAPGPAIPTSSNGRPSTPSPLSSTSTSTPSNPISTTYQITPTGYVIFGNDLRSQQVRRDMEELLSVLFPGTTIHTGRAELAEAESQLLRLAQSLAVAFHKRWFLLQTARGDYDDLRGPNGSMSLFNVEALQRAFKLVGSSGAAEGSLRRGRELETERESEPGRERQRRRREMHMLENVDPHMSNGEGHNDHFHIANNGHNGNHNLNINGHNATSGHNGHNGNHSAAPAPANANAATSANANVNGTPAPAPAASGGGGGGGNGASSPIPEPPFYPETSTSTSISTSIFPGQASASSSFRRM